MRVLCVCLERLSYDLEMKTREQNKNNKETEIKRFDWFIERIQTHLAFGWLSERSAKKNFMPEELSRNQSILRFDVILQHDWPSEQCLLHIRVFFGGKTKSPCFVLFIHWLIKQITNTYGNHFSRSYENCSIGLLNVSLKRTCLRGRRLKLKGQGVLGAPIPGLCILRDRETAPRALRPSRFSRA